MSGVRRETRINDLYDFLVDHPEGVTIEDIAADQGGVSTIYCRMLVQGLRDMLGDSDTINVPCDPDPGNPNGPWLYRLVGTMDEVQGWSSNRLGDTERRVRTMHSVIKSIVVSTKGNTKDGKKARLMDKSYGRLIEDLNDLEAEL